MATYSADYCVLVNEWVWSKSQDCLLRPEVGMGEVLESELESRPQTPPTREGLVTSG